MFLDDSKYVRINEIQSYTELYYRILRNGMFSVYLKVSNKY